LKTFFGAISSEVISQIAISKSICGNLNSLFGVGQHARNTNHQLKTDAPLEEPRHPEA
jgi:hypothetical protein